MIRRMCFLLIAPLMTPQLRGLQLLALNISWSVTYCTRVICSVLYSSDELLAVGLSRTTLEEVG